MSADYSGLTRNSWPGTWSPSSTHPIVLDTEVRGTLQSISGSSGDRLTDISGQRLAEGMIVWVKGAYSAGGASRSSSTYYTYRLQSGQSRDANTGAMPNAEANWSVFNGADPSSLINSTNTGTNNISGSLAVGGDLSVTGTITTNSGTVITSIYAGTDTAVSALTGNTTIWNNSTLQSVTSRGATTNQVISITNTTNANSTVTGALLVSGGVGIGGALYVSGPIYSGNSSVVVTSANIGSYGASTLTAGTDTAVSTTTGNIVFWSNSTLQSVTARGSITDQSVTITNNTVSTSTTTGALVVKGGVGIGGSLNVSGPASVARDFVVGDTVYSSFESPSITVEGEVSLDSFSISEYRTAKYLVQVVDFGTSPSMVHTEELMVTHDDNGADTMTYISQYGLITTNGELGAWDATYSAGKVTLKFIPDYDPISMVIKINRIAIST